MMFRWAAMALGTAVASASFSGIANAAPTEDYSAALELFDEYRYAAGLPALRKAAEGGHVLARRTLGLMLLHGQDLYGVEVHRNRAEAAAWLRLAAAGGCEVSALVLSRLGRPVASNDRPT